MVRSGWSLRRSTTRSARSQAGSSSKEKIRPFRSPRKSRPVPLDSNEHDGVLEREVGKGKLDGKGGGGSGVPAIREPVHGGRWASVLDRLEVAEPPEVT